jgi:hypothetical protein
MLIEGDDEDSKKYEDGEKIQSGIFEMNPEKYVHMKGSN